MTAGNVVALLLIVALYLGGAALRTYRLGKPTWPFKVKTGA
jgi:hypothetical protein